MHMHVSSIVNVWFPMSEFTLVVSSSLPQQCISYLQFFFFKWTFSCYKL